MRRIQPHDGVDTLAEKIEEKLRGGGENRP